MPNYEVGDIAISKAGRDKACRYLIIAAEKDFVYLADGKLKTVEKAKKKNIKHIQIVHVDKHPIKEKIRNGIRNEEIKYFLKTFGGKNV